MINQSYELSLCIIFLYRMNTFFDERISRCISDQQEIERLGSYKPRSGGIGKSLSKYSPELFAKLKADDSLRKVMSYLEYTDLLEKPSDQWHTLEPLDNCGHEHAASWEGSTTVKKVVFVNNPSRVVRTRAENTPWQQIKKDLGILSKECDCAKCRAEKENKKAGGINRTAEPCEKKAQGDNFSEETEKKKAGGDAVEKQPVTNDSTADFEEKKENLDDNDNSNMILSRVPLHMKNKKVERVEDKEMPKFLDMATLMKAVNMEWNDTLPIEGDKLRH
jgi:hypothetical protein